MGSTILVEANIASGAKLIDALDKRGFLISSAFWILDKESQEWLLVLAMPSVDREGAHSVYSKIRPLVESVSNLSLLDVRVVSPKDATVQLMNSQIQTGPGIAGIRFTGNVIGSVLIEDAYIYRLNERPKAKAS